ncbi:MAG TPA: DUF1684 domain-containing protein [Candidatus Limnocylindria bacterium]|nr:DUF1684 domain-containing protein [Candidatus Limnocylindria bacterium]
MSVTGEHLALTDWRRRVFAMYDALRRDTRAEPMRLVAFRSAKDRLFAEHPSSPIPADRRRDFRGLAYWRHDPALRLVVPFEPDPEAPGTEIPRSNGGGGFAFRRIGQVRFEVGGTGCALSVYWIEGYAGGIFIPFRDATSGSATYGGGRYVWDAIKGADLGSEDGRLVIDFNYAYHPSCAYDPRWSCPLAPAENWLGVAIEAGERLMPDSVRHESAA